MTDHTTECRYCGLSNHRMDRPELCPQVRAVEYRKDGSVKRVELGPRVVWQQPWTIVQSPVTPTVQPSVTPAPSTWPYRPNVCHDAIAHRFAVGRS